MIERQHGDDAPGHIASRSRDLALAGDEAGVQRWMKIATKYDQLRAIDTDSDLTCAGRSHPHYH